MQITCGLSLRHPIVLVTIVNLCLIGISFYLRIFVLHEPSYRFPYPLEIIGAVLLCYVPLYIVANPREMRNLFLPTQSQSRLPEDIYRGTGWKIVGYGYALFVFFIGVILNYQFM